eukprot:13054651-Alexandrium_andersonii.AAC.1
MVSVARLCSQKAVETGQELAFFKADVKKAFDSVDHCSVARALLGKGVPGLIVSALLRDMRGTRLSFAAPGLSAHTEGIRMKRGVRQGACTSPAVW